MLHLRTIIIVLLGANIFELCQCKNVAENLSEVTSENQSVKYELIFAQIIHRHGERNVLKAYPNDPYANESYWPGGFGELTKVGKKQLFDLGKYLRQRYQKLIGPHYSSKKVYIYSTNMDRALMSAESLAAGMFPPSGDAIWNDELNWQPIPIHTRDLTKDYLTGSPFFCPRFEQLYNKFCDSPEFKYQSEKHVDFIKYLEAHAGNISMPLLFQILEMEKEKGLELPIWTRYISHFTNDTMQQILDIHFQALTKTKEMQKFGAGFLLKEILDRFKNKSLSLLQPDRSVWIFSGHDFSILNMLRTLNLNELQVPVYASSLYFELYKGNGSHFVQVFYRRTPTENVPPPLEIPNCGTICPLDKFYELYADILPKEYEDFETLCNSAIAMIINHAQCVFALFLTTMFYYYQSV
ncbi:prostatic acid phosphatase-like [Contarinia nasturtii]|uniref:prostatic acid phosphatase-like n=1 Tax=Contarinia nasturtii TaxID=265458 RepID=UPI0012D46486|nr:prostatic acid phosphatase-like [Contarinia nasturtii]